VPLPFLPLHGKPAMTVIELTSKHNPLFKRIRLIASQSRRAPASIALVEGIRALEEASKASCITECALISDDFGKDGREHALMKQWQAQDAKLYRAKRALIESVSEVQSFQGALALVAIPHLSLETVVLSANPLILCICGIQDPGNMGTLLRTALAAGVSLVCATKGSVSATNPKVIRASAGAFFHLPLVENLSPSELMNFLGSHGIKILRADAHGQLQYTECSFRSPCAVLLGNEGQGFTIQDWKGSQTVAIPMAGGVESINVAVAGAVILFEAYKQRSLAHKKQKLASTEI
jgi:RNA methyltransferase, TrmH family